jgi:hypothetical protein
MRRDDTIRGTAGLAVLLWASAAGGASLEVVAAKVAPFCEAVAALFTERLDPGPDLTNTVRWAPVDLKGQGPKNRHCSSLDQAVFDVNNDGRDELVVKTTFCMKGAPSDSLYIFPADSPVLADAQWQDLAPLLATGDKFERTGGTYVPSLQVTEGAAPQPLAGVFRVTPFLFDGAAYLALTDGGRKGTVIARYLGGERFDDQCYLKAARF